MSKFFLLSLACALLAHSAAAHELRTKLQQLGFVPGKQDPECVEPVYKAEISGERLSVRRMTASDTPFPTDLRHHSFEARNLRYEAEDNGEWGGKLEIVTRSGERRLLLEGNVQAMLQVTDDLYVFEGLSHLSMATGSVHAIRHFDAEPNVERVTLLTDTPVFATLVRKPRGRHWFWIVGTNSLTELVEEFRVLTVHPFGDDYVREFGGLAEDEQDGVVIGTCGGVLAFQPHCRMFVRGGEFDPCKPQFYVPARSRR